MKMLMFVGAVLVANGLFAEAKEKAPKSPAEIEAIRQERAMKRFGGYIERKGTQQGTICYVNCQKTVPKEWLEESIRYLTQMTHYNIVCREGAFDITNPKIEGNVSLFVIDDPKYPALLVAPENRWALVNVAVVAKEKRPAFFHARMKKQLSRGFAYLCGAANSQFQETLVRAIVDEADLDRNLDDQLPMDVFQRFYSYMSGLGVKPALYSTYKKACEEGWAPAPTNDVQKAIWDKVHAMPKNPMKIEFDPKKGR